jgi:hypothetical protein
MLTAEADLSFDDQQALLNGALREQFGLDPQCCQMRGQCCGGACCQNGCCGGESCQCAACQGPCCYGNCCCGQGCPRFNLFETFGDYIVARGADSKLYRIPYTMDGTDVKFGDAQEVTTAYVPVSESCAFLAAEADAQPVSGKYPIVVLKAGWGTGSVAGQALPHYYPPAFVGLVAEAVSGKPFGREHPDMRGPDPTGATKPDRIAGWLEGGAFDGKQATSTVNLFTAESKLRSNLDDARQNKKLDLFAVSMLAAIGYKPGVVEGKQCLVAESLGSLYSVDLCARAGAGGQFITAASFAGNDLAAAQLRAVNSQSTAISPSARRTNRGGAEGATEGAAMKDTLRKLLDALRGKNPSRAAELTMKFATVAEADYPALLTEVTTAVLETPAPAVAAVTTTAVTAEAVQTMLSDAKRIQSRNRIESKLAESKLPEPAKKLARTHLEAALTAEADVADTVIDAEITSVRDAFAAFQNVGTVRGTTGVTLDSGEKQLLAMEAAFGVKESMGKGVPAFRGIREAYTTITGDWDLAKLGRGAGFSGHVLTSEAVLTGDFPNILLNSMTKRLLQDWAELALDGLPMLYTTATISDYKLQDRVREGYFGSLPIVTEGATYQELTKPTDERISYQVAKRGGLLTISEETIRNDDLGAIARFPGRLARSGRTTLKEYITSFFINNPNYGGDGVSWFNAGHNNLAAVPLTTDALTAARTSLRRQTEKDSGKPLGLNLYWLMVPPEMESTATSINQTDTAGSNQFYHAFGVNNERIIVNELLADTNDWYYGAQQETAPFLEIGFLDGISQPQIFLANQPTVGTQFTADELQYKTKFVFNGAPIDFRGVGKSVNA